MNLPALYTLVDDYLLAYQKMQDADLPEEVIRDTLEGLQYPIEEKTTAIASMVRNMESFADQIDTAVDQMKARSTSARNRAERIKAYAKESMERAGISKIECPYFRVAIRKNPPKVLIDESAVIPAKYLTTPPPPEPKPNRTALKQAIEAGEAIEGVSVVQDTRLEIK